MAELILDLDVGNSTTKWRLSGAETHRLKNQAIEQLVGVIGAEPDRIRVACVSDNIFRAKLLNILRRGFSCEPEFAESTPFCAGLENGYMKPEALGVDRWLAALAVWRKDVAGPCLVIDVGSALTVDTVDDEGIFRGGYIIPGLAAMQQSLIENMGRVNCSIEDGVPEGYLRIPTDTTRAVHWGACFALTATVEKAIAVFLLQWPRGTVRITGGNGRDIAIALNKEEAYRPDLVLDGLAVALP